MKFFFRRINNLKILGCLLQMAPFVRAVILTGSMTTGSAKKSSDIDLLIISQSGRLYIARLFATFLASLTDIRRKPNDKVAAGKFCLNFYLSANNLDILPHTARCANFHRYAVNIWDSGEIYERMMRQNFWLRRFPVAIKNQNAVRRIKDNFPIIRSLILTAVQKIGELILGGRFGDFVENKQFAWQKKLIEGRKMFKMDKYRFVIAKNELRLHPRKS